MLLFSEIDVPYIQRGCSRSRVGRMEPAIVSDIDKGEQRLRQHAGDKNCGHRGDNDRGAQPGAAHAAPAPASWIIKNGVISFRQPDLLSILLLKFRRDHDLVVDSTVSGARSVH